MMLSKPLCLLSVAVAVRLSNVRLSKAVVYLAHDSRGWAVQGQRAISLVKIGVLYKMN